MQNNRKETKYMQNNFQSLLRLIRRHRLSRAEAVTCQN